MRVFWMALQVLSAAVLVQPLRAADGDLRWTFQAADVIFGSPAVDAGGTIYFGSRDGKVYAVGPSGALKWSFQTGDWVDSSPTLSVDDSVLYVGSWDNKLYALATATRADRKLWEFETGSLIVASPTVDVYGNLFFGSSDGFLYSLPANGELRWSYFVGAEMDSSPSVDKNGNVYVGAYDGILYAFSNDGDPLWEFATRTTADPSDQRIVSPPTIGDAGEIYFGGGDGFLYALDSTGSLLWEFEAGEKVDTGVAITAEGNLVFASRNGSAYMVDELGVLMWESFVGDVFYSTPAIDSQGRIYVGSYLGNGVSGLSVLDGQGDLVWEYLLLDYVDSSPVIDSNGQVIFGCYDGALYSVATSGSAAATGWSRFGADRSNRSRRTGRFGEWLAAKGLFGEAADPCQDQDGDGRSLVLEYLLGRDPESPDWPDVRVMGGESPQNAVVIEYERVIGESELDYAFEYSNDLETWTPVELEAAIKMEVVAEDTFGDGWYETVQLRLSMPEELPEFVRASASCE